MARVVRTDSRAGFTPGYLDLPIPRPTCPFAEPRIHIIGLDRPVQNQKDTPRGVTLNFRGFGIFMGI